MACSGSGSLGREKIGKTILKTRQILHELGLPYTTENALLVQQVVGETIIAVLAADTRDLVFTTHDKNFAAGVISRAVDSVRKHWNFDATN